MKVEVNIEKKYAFLIAGVFLLLAVSIFVNAYNSAGTGGVPSAMGHSVDEIDWSKYLPGTGIRWGNSTVGGSLQGDGASIELAGGWPYIDFKTFAAGHNPDYDVRLTSAGTNDSLFLQGGSFCFEDGSCRNTWSGIGISSQKCYAIQPERSRSPVCRDGFYIKAMMKYTDDNWDGYGAICCSSGASNDPALVDFATLANQCPWGWGRVSCGELKKTVTPPTYPAGYGGW